VRGRGAGTGCGGGRFIGFSLDDIKTEIVTHIIKINNADKIIAAAMLLFIVFWYGHTGFPW